MWLKFTAAYCWKATTAVNIVFKPDGGPFKDGRYPVTRECAREAVAHGAAVAVKTPKRPR